MLRPGSRLPLDLDLTPYWWRFSVSLEGGRLARPPRGDLEIYPLDGSAHLRKFSIWEERPDIGIATPRKAIDGLFIACASMSYHISVCEQQEGPYWALRHPTEYPSKM